MGMVKKIKLLWKQFLCIHHWHKVVGGKLLACAFHNRDVRAESYLCCLCAREGDAYDFYKGL